MVAVFIGIGAVSASAQAARIGRLEIADALFRQYTSDVADARQLLARGMPAADLVGFLAVYSYVPTAADNLFAVAARCNLPYESLATLNRIATPSAFKTGDPLLLPTIPGLFIPELADSDFEELLLAARGGAEAVSIAVTTAVGDRRFHFLPGAELNSTERAFFLNIFFRFPLPSGRLTSAFGPRINPVTGNPSRHAGLDLAAAIGTEVYACRDGEVTAVGDDPILGKYIKLRHDNGWESVYGHLSAILADLKKPVRSGSIIAQVGSTGQSTGPHLHFELRRNGEARDPASHLGGGLGR